MAGTPKLIILSEQFRGRTFELTKDQHTVGRVDERDICIKDPTISTYHCRFIKSGNTYIVEDQGSTNGTRVNNVPVVSQVLQNSDILQIGGVEILYDCDDKSVTTVVQQTTTDIDVNAASTTQTIPRMDQFGFTKRNRSNSSQKIMIALFVLLSLLVIGLLVFLVLQMINRPQEIMSPQPVNTVMQAPAIPIPQNSQQSVQPAAQTVQMPAAPQQPVQQPASPQPVQPAASQSVPAETVPAPVQPAAQQPVRTDPVPAAPAPAAAPAVQP